MGSDPRAFPSKATTFLHYLDGVGGLHTYPSSGLKNMYVAPIFRRVLLSAKAGLFLWAPSSLPWAVHLFFSPSNAQPLRSIK